MAENNPSNRPQWPQDGAAKPNPAPPPPSSVIPDEKQKAANEALDEFYEKMKEVNESIARTNALVKNEAELQKKVNDAYLKNEQTAKKVAKSEEELVKEHKKYKDAQGNWIKGTESIQELFEIKMGELRGELQSASNEFEQASEALLENKKKVEEEKDVRASAIFSLRELRATVKDFDAALGAEMVRDFNKVIQDSTKVNKEASENQKKISEETNKAANQMLEGLRRANVEELAKNAKSAIEIAQKKAEFDAKNQANDAMSAIAAAGGIVGATDIRAVLDDFGSKIDEEFKILNPEASEQEIKKNREEQLLLRRESIIQEISFQKMLDVQKRQEERIKELMKEKGVSREKALKIDAPKQEEEEKVLQEEITQISQSLDNLTDAQLLEIAKADADRIKEAERLAEANTSAPEWAKQFIDGLEGIKELLELGNIKDNGFWKTLLFFLVIAVGSVLGYIWTYLQVIGSIITSIPKLLMKLPFGIGNAIGEFFGKIRSYFTRIITSIKDTISGGFAKIKNIFPKISGGGFKSILESFKNGLKFIMKFFPGLSGFMGQLGKAFQFGFRVLGKVFFWIGLAVDVIMGMVKGFKEMPNIKGILIGAVAGIVNFFTFGLLDFKKTFDFINNVFGSIFDGLAAVLQPIIDYFVESFGYIKEAFSKIIAIFSGEGSFFGKLIKTLGVLISTGIKIAISYIIAAVKVAFAILFKLPYYILKFIWESVNKGVELLAEGMVWLWDYITSGELLGDLLKFGDWLYDELVGFFTDIINAIADGLGKIPGIGGYIKDFLGGGSPSNSDKTETTKQITEYAKQAPEAVTKTAQTTTGPIAPNIQDRQGNIIPIHREDGSVIPYQPITPAIHIREAASTAATAQREATTPPAGNVAIHAPTTTVATSGGNQGGSPTMFPTNNRNTEPTFRALLFTENPAF